MQVILKEEQFNRIFLTENRESKNMAIARGVVRKYNSHANSMQILNAVRNDIPSSRLNQCAFLPGVVRMYMDGQIKDGATIGKLNQSLKLLASAHSSEYDNNLNGLSAQELIDRFQTAVRSDFEQKRDANAKRKYSGKTNYKIVLIQNAEEASEYAQYVTWCVCTSLSMYDSYTHDGMGVFYFLLQDGFQNVPRVEGPGCPLDEYGLSMIAVSINEDGSINTVTCRWNHDNGGNDNVMTDEQLSNLLGQDVYQVLKPVGVEVLAENERFRVIKKGDKCTLLDKKYENYTPFDKYGYANFYDRHGSYQALRGKVNIKGEIIIKPKYFSMNAMESDGCCLVNLYGIGLVNSNGEEIINPKADDAPSIISSASPNGARFFKDSIKRPGLMNLKLKKEIQPGTYEKIEPIDKDMRFRVTDFDGNTALINDKLEFDLPFNNKYDWIDVCETFYGQPVRIVTNQNDLYGIVDKNLQEILPCEYGYVDVVGGDGNIRIVKGSKKEGNRKKGKLAVDNGYYVIEWENGEKEIIRKI